MIIQENVPLAEYTSWLVGGSADYFCMAQTVEEIKKAWAWAHEQNVPVTVLGGGTNVLISDRGIRGLTICLRRFSGSETQERDGRFYVTALAGTAKSELLKAFLRQKLAPALFLAGLPGDVGGGVVMNAGVAESLQPREFGEIVDWVEVLRFENGHFVLKHLLHDEIDWSYRHSHGWQPGIVVRVGMSWAMSPEVDLLERVKAANKTRLSKQPLDMPSCGSTFINPPGHKAAQLIDSCGLKGFRVGDAQVSLKHANFMVNLGQATSEDLWTLIMHVQKTVKDITGVEMVTEVVRLGDWPS